MSCCACCILGLMTLVSLLVYLWFYKSWVYIKYGQKLLLCLTGSKTKRVQLDDGVTLSYAERGSQKDGRSTLVLLHGYTLSKELWIPLLFNLPKNYCHVIMIDLPGHGDSSIPDEGVKQTLDYYIESVHQLLCKIGLENRPIHIGGMSMGGLVTGMYAVKYPGHTKQVSIMCPAMTCPKITPPFQQLLDGKNTLLAKDLEGVYRTLKLNTVKPIPENDQLLKGILESRIDRYPYYTRVYKDMLGREDVMKTLEENVHKIAAPTHVLWGECDKLLDVSGAEVLQKNLQTCVQKDIIGNCGHLLTSDQPRHIANCLVAYRQAT